jgi:cytosine/adenosine deaminase-related metal-dependent hydrolase
VTGRYRRYTADWVVPVAAAPARDGAVLLDPAGRIVAVGPSEAVPDPPDTVHRSFPGAAILPGLVNAHTHLELTGLDGQVPDEEFPEWVVHLVAIKRVRSPEVVRAAARKGIEDCWRMGVTTVADTGDSGAVIEALADLGASGIAYHEVFGPDPRLVEESLAEWAARLEQLGRFVGGRVRLGASPHAPFTVSGPLYRRAAAHARSVGLPLAMHIAESSAEAELVATGSGGFARRWVDRGIEPVAARTTPIEWLDQLGVLGPDALCIHCVQATDDDLGRLAAHGSAVAHCPRSNRRHRHGDAPVRAFLDRRLRVGVGTDSVASVAPLDLLAEARIARELGALSAWQTVDLVTRGAASAIGMEADVGSLAPGRWGDLAVFRIGPQLDQDQLPDTLVSLGTAALLCTVLAGREVWMAPGATERPDGAHPLPPRS